MQFEAALYRLTPGDTTQAPLALRLLARNYLMDGDPDAAMDCAEAALAVAQATGDVGGEGYARNAQAGIHWACGELDRAEALYADARRCALASEERALLAMTSANLGAIAAIRGQLFEALHHFTIGLEQYRALDRLNDAWVALNNIGRLSSDLLRWPEAERAYAEAIAIVDALGDRSARVILEVNLAEMWLARGETDRAAGALDAAERLSADTGDAAWTARIAKLRGVLLRDAGAPVEAERLFETAVSLAEARQDVLLLAETLRERAELYRSEGRNRDALHNLNRSHRLFTQLRARRELANVDRSVARLEHEFIDMVRRWGESIEAKDRYTQGHCVRVADVACAIASLCGIEGQSLFWFRIGALLHDVGKLVVPSEVLNKVGRLDPDEWALMRSHPTAGVDMLAGIDFPWDVRPIIESHHERWDGGGYPHGLRGEAIPLSARILAIADVYDALTSVRSYKDALTHDAAVAAMRQDVGRAFDPDVFAKFEALLRDGCVAPQSSLPPTRHAALAQTPSGAAPAASTEDPATRLPTRDSMVRIAAQALSDHAATQRELSLIVLDLTAREPSQTGDEVAELPRPTLRWIARELRNATRATDFVARTGPCQFMALLRESSSQQAHTVMRRIEAALSRRSPSGVRRVADASWIRMAVVTAPADGASVTELLRNAERAAARGDERRRADRAG